MSKLSVVPPTEHPVVLRLRMLADEISRGEVPVTTIAIVAMHGTEYAFIQPIGIEVSEASLIGALELAKLEVFDNA